MNRAETLAQLDRLLTIMDELREKCPWDREQTWESIRHLSIEEVYELSDAILDKDTTEVKKELGDLLLHIVFYSRIASETGLFGMGDVADELCNKLIRRHPHIYGEVKADNADAVKSNWEQIKLQEKGNERKSVLQGLPKSMPALVKAYRMQEKVASVGFDWNTADECFAKVKEELQEFEQAGNPKEKEEEFGDLLFALVNYARKAGINPDDALEQTNRKFQRRFEHIEKRAAEQNTELGSLTLTEMDVYWDEAKRSE
ncbi:MAG: nucleoside triphosphate pyrophosphohydrolase [Bacteroidetes bacterium]|nr:nucleoside triphosphate pyrophosphohydrolase [Bacteroidota bacterium]